MRHKKRSCLLLALVLVLGIFPPGALAAQEAPEYYYDLICVRDKDGKLLDGSTDGKIVLELYVRYDGGEPYGPVVDSGAFGLRFPKWVTDAAFAASKNITVRRLVPDARYPYPEGSGEIQKDSYHAFLWTRVPEKETWDFNTIRGVHILLGTYTLTLPKDSHGTYQLPGKTSVGRLNWLTAAEAMPLEYPESRRPAAEEDEFNKTVWDAASGQYVGYYLANPASSAAEDVGLTRAPLTFQFQAPDSWPNAFTALSYDPKKELTVRLYDDAGALAADTFDVPRWTDATTADTGTLYAGTDSNRNAGTGAYFSAVDLSDVSLKGAPVELTPGKTYRLELSKPGHLTVSLTLKAVTSQLSDCEGFPADDAPVYLPCGDVNPTPDGIGDGRIDMADRAVLMRYIGGGNPLGEGEPADLDGDGRVTGSDLSILMSSANYGRREQ